MSAAHQCDQEKWLRALPLPEMFRLAASVGCSVANEQRAIDDLMVRSHTKLLAVQNTLRGVA